jgi:hypothetical protein
MMQSIVQHRVLCMKVIICSPIMTVCHTWRPTRDTTPPCACAILHFLVGPLHPRKGLDNCHGRGHCIWIRVGDIRMGSGNHQSEKRLRDTADEMQDVVNGSTNHRVWYYKGGCVCGDEICCTLTAKISRLGVSGSGSNHTPRKDHPSYLPFPDQRMRRCKVQSMILHEVIGCPPMIGYLLASRM